jgi:preprotein translocase subunit YajC
MLLVGATAYFFLIHLPEQERMEAENKMQADINKVATVEVGNHTNLLNTLQSYFQ